MYITLTEGSSTHSEKSTEEIAKARAAGEPWGARHIFYPAIPPQPRRHRRASS